MRTTFMFPGQGSQTKGMGGPLFDEFQELVATADDILGYSVRELCLQDPRGELGQTQFTQPALYVVNAMGCLHRLRRGPAPDALIGHSVGELNALLAAGVFSFETGLRLAQQRGLLMSQAQGGAMAAVMNVPAEELRRLLRDHGLDGIDLANFNTPDQIVISGRSEDIQQARAIFAARQTPFVPLNTSGAFHSRYMRPAQERFDALLAGVELLAPRITVISNYTARPYGHGDIRANLAHQLANPVKWSEGIEYLMGLGEMTFEEMGAGKTLTHMVAKIAKARRPAAPRLSADESVQRWNAKHGVGTKVRSHVIKGPVLETKTKAVVLFGHRAAVYLQDYNGYFALDELTVVAES
ncbi:ACP S-malonyltransferase [Myxococcaceae bacterium JPH2]|nr:ACP S-malonyltransferase [Myxococcaceae bacterium JPH2]